MRAPLADLSNEEDLNMVRSLEERARALIVFSIFFNIITYINDFNYNTFIITLWIITKCISVFTLLKLHELKHRHTLLGSSLLSLVFFVFTPISLILYSIPYSKLKTEETVKPPKRRFKKIKPILMKLFAINFIKTNIQSIHIGFKRIYIIISLFLMPFITFIISYESHYHYYSPEAHLKINNLISSFIVYLVIQYIILLAVLWVREGFIKHKKT